MADRYILLQVLALQGMVIQHPSGITSSLHDFSMGLNLRVLDLSRVRYHGDESGLSSREGIDQGDKLQLPPNLRELNLAGVCPAAPSYCLAAVAKYKQMS